MLILKRVSALLLSPIVSIYPGDSLFHSIIPLKTDTIPVLRGPTLGPQLTRIRRHVMSVGVAKTISDPRRHRAAAVSRGWKVRAPVTAAGTRHTDVDPNYN